MNYVIASLALTERNENLFSSATVWCNDLKDMLNNTVII